MSALDKIRQAFPDLKNASDSELLGEISKLTKKPYESLADTLGVDPRGTVAETARQIGAGVAVDLPRMVGQGLQYTGIAPKLGQSLVAGAEEREPGWTPDMRGRGLIGEALVTGARAVGPMAPAIAASLLPGGQFIAPTVAAGLFGTSSAQETYEKLKKQGVSEEDAIAAARRVGLIQGPLEGVATAVGMKAFSAAKPLVGLGGTTAGVASRLTDTAVLKPFAKGMATNLVVQPGTEVLQDVGAAKVEEAYGGKPEDIAGIARSSALGGLGLTLLLGPLAIGGHVARANRAEKLKEALYSPDIPPEIRAKAMDLVMGEARRQKVPEANVDQWFEQQLTMEDARNAELAKLEEEQRAGERNLLTTEEEPIQQRIDKKLGLTGKTDRKDYEKQFEAAFTEGTGQRVADAVTGVERELTAGELAQRNLPQDLTAPAGTAAAATGETKPTAPSIFSETDTALNKLGVKPTKNSRGIYDYLMAEGIDPASTEAEPVINALVNGKLGEARKAVGEIIRARSSRGTGISTVQQPAGSVGVGSPVVQGSLGDAGRTAPVAGAVVGGAPAAGAPLQQAGILPSPAGQPSTSVTQNEVDNLLGVLANGGFGPGSDQTADDRKLVRKMVANAIDKGLAAGQTNEQILASIDNSTRQVLGTNTITELDKLINQKRNGTQAPQTIQTAPQGQTATTVPAAAPIKANTTLRLTKQQPVEDQEAALSDYVEIARATGNTTGIDATLADAAGKRQDQKDFTKENLDEIIEAQLGKGKNQERDRKILRAYVLARRAAPYGNKVKISNQVGAAFGITGDRVRQIGNPEKLADIAVSMGFDRNQVFTELGIDSTKEAAVDLSKTNEPTGQDGDTEVPVGDAAEIVEDTAEGDVEVLADDSRFWQEASTAGSQAAVNLVTLADKIADLREVAAELEQIGVPEVVAATAARIDELTAQYEAIVAGYEAKPEAEAAAPRKGRGKGKAKSEAAEKVAEEKDAAKEAEAAKFRAERAAKLQADRNGLAVGDTVKNPKLGTGVVKSFAGDGDATTVTVAFQSGQTKELSVKLAKLEKTDAVQVKSAASVPVQPKAETGEKVGRQVRRAPKPATESKAPTVILTQAEQAAQAWDKVAADFPEAPKFADLTKAQQNNFIGFGPDNWERGDVELELTKMARATASTQRTLTNEPITIDVEARVVEETVAPQVAKLPAPQVTRLENHYGVKQDSPEFLAKVKADVVLYATKGAEAVAGAIRDIIKAIHAGVLSVAMIFNPTAVSQIEAFVVIPQETQTTTQQVLAELPAEVQGMSEAGKQAYATLIPALKGKIGDKFVTIADKPSGRIFVFKANGELVLQQKALFGLAKGDLYKGNNDLKQNRVTPAGLFGINVIDAAKGGAAATTAGDYDFGKVFALDDPDATVTFMHSVWLKESDAAKRAAALKNDSAADSRYSFGCINVDKETFKDMVGKYSANMDGSKLFVVPDVQSTVNDFLTGNVANDRLVREGVQPVTKTTTTPVKSATQTANVDRTVTAKEEELFFRKSRQSTRLFSTDLYLGKENVPGQPQYGRELRNPVTLADGTRLDGFTSPDQSVFSGYDRNGQRVSVPQSSLNPADIKSSRDSNRTANALKAALGTTRKSRRSVRSADQSGVEFESVEASLEDLSNYSEGIAAGIRGLQNAGMGNAVDAIDSWMVTFSPVSWDAIYTIIDGKRTIIYNGVILKDKVLATTATLHEVGHGIDEVQGGAGKFSGDKEFKVSRVNGELMAMRPGTAMDELLTHWEDSSETSALGGMLNYPFDMTDPENRSLTMQELREEVFAQVWAFSNMNGGMDYLRANLPTTHAFMEKAHEQVKATNYTTAQGAQQGAQSGQVQAGQQNAQPAGAVLRASRQPKGLIDRNIAKLPKVAQQPVKRVTEALGDLGGKYLDYAVFTNDLVKRAQALGLGAAKTFSDRLAARNAKVSEEERKIEKIADRYALIEDVNKGDGPGSVNEFLFESTRTGKWGYDTANFKADPAMKAMFDKLQPKAQQFVKDVFAHGDATLSNKKKIVLEATNSEYDAMIKAAQDLANTATDSKVKADAEKELAKLKAEKAATLKRFQTLFRLREGVPYAPIKRTGAYVVIGESAAYKAAKANKDTATIKKLESDPDHYHVSFVDTKWQARNLKDNLTEQGVFDSPQIVKRSESFDEAFSGEAMLPALTKMRAAVDRRAQDANGKKDPTAGKLLNIINQLYLEALAEGSARKSEMRRRGVAGEVDMLQSFTQQGRADANFLASVEFEPKIQDALQQMRNQSRTGDRERKSEIFDELTQRYADSLEPKDNPFINGLTNMASKFFLASSPGYYLQNLTQPFMMSLPAMAGRHDYIKAGRALYDAYAELGPLFKDVKLFDQQFDFSKVPADVREAINDLVNQGKIDIGLATEINEYKVEADGNLSKFAQRLNKGMRMAVQKVEATNRLSTAIAAYRLEYARTKDAAKATQYAADILTETHGDYTAFNAPRAFNTQWGKVALQFRKFQLIQIAFYTKLIRDAFTNPAERSAALKTLGYSLGHTAVFAGMMGLPGYAAISAILSSLGGDDDEPYDLTAEMRKALGPEWADIIMRGAPTIAGMDLSGKIGAGNMLSIMPFSDADLATNAGRAEAFGTLMGGASLGMVSRVADGLGLIASGDYYKGIERVMPKGVSDALKAARQGAEGMTRRNGDVILPDSEVSALDTVWTAMGVPSVKQAVTYERQNRMRDITENFSDRTTRIKNDYAKAVRQQDTEGMAEARTAWTKLQQARQRNGLKPQPVSSLLKAPQEQRAREQRTVGGVAYREGQRKLAESVAEN